MGTQLTGLPDTIVRAARTLHRRVRQIPGAWQRTRAAGRFISPARRPWHGDDYTRALDRIRALRTAV